MRTPCAKGLQKVGRVNVYTTVRTASFVILDSIKKKTCRNHYVLSFQHHLAINTEAVPNCDRAVSWTRIFFALRESKIHLQKPIALFISKLKFRGRISRPHQSRCC